LSGWSVTEVLPAGSTLVGLSGNGYTCYTNLVCVSSTTLAAGADGNPITVVVQIPADLIGQFKNVAYVSPAEPETTETNPLVVPTIETDAVATATDNDAQAVIDVLPPQPEGIMITLPNTGTTIPLTWLLVAIGIVAAGVILLSASRFNARGRKN
jgi:LPXTG-motif cell wall-anchored protein